eukprot:56369_1
MTLRRTLQYMSLIIHVSSQLNISNITTTLSPQTTIPSQYFTTEPSCSANYAYVYIESTLSTLSATVLSERVNYPPYGYSTEILNKQIVLFANGENITNTVNNPCNISTWITPKSYYNNTIVLIMYNKNYDTLCNTQQWILNLQNYGNINGVLIGNDQISSVYALSGDTSISDPIIPTRMISKQTATEIINTIQNTTENVFASIDCFPDTTHPPKICITDNDNQAIGLNLALDGEFQEQANIMVNDHPVWYKEGHTGTIGYPDHYIWLTVNHSIDNRNNPWRWVIGTNYSDINSIELQCLLNITEYIDDPTLCGHNWYTNNVNNTHMIKVNISSHGGICNIGDIFICIDSTNPILTFLKGYYRQSHKNIAYWISETKSDIYIQIYSNLFGQGELEFIIVVAGYIQAVCLMENSEQSLYPYTCDFWYINCQFGCQLTDIDVDKCEHPNATINATTIIYPQSICFNDLSNNNSSFYQGYYGIYILDNTTQSDGRYIYRNQRLDAISNITWYFMYYDPYDQWLLTLDGSFGVYAQCDEDVATPDLCDDCWRFWHGFIVEINCNISITPINSTMESDCIGNTTNNIVNYTSEIIACFDDGMTNTYSNQLTGIYRLTNITFNSRGVWSKYIYVNDSIDIIWYVYYNNIWKYWIIDTVIEEQLVPSWNFVCLLWEEYEPWNCINWYSTINGNVTVTIMNAQCTFQPTIDPTIEPTIDPTIDPTINPTVQTSITTGNPTNIPSTLETSISVTDSQDFDDKQSNNDKGNLDTVIIVVVVLGILFLIVIGVGVALYMKKGKNDDSVQDVHVEKAEMVGQIAINKAQNENNNDNVETLEMNDGSISKEKDDIWQFKSGDTFSM